jgi:hypothetical protein
MQAPAMSAARDFFSPQASADRLDPMFVWLAEDEAFSPARGIIEPMMHWYENPDGNFVELFQTVAFDARICELGVDDTQRQGRDARRRAGPSAVQPH